MNYLENIIFILIIKAFQILMIYKKKKAVFSHCPNFYLNGD